MEKRAVHPWVDERKETEIFLYIFGDGIKKPADGHALGWFEY
jgi:hypothetical protein